MKSFALAMTFVGLAVSVVFHASPTDRRAALNVLIDCHDRELTDLDVAEIERAIGAIIPWRKYENLGIPALGTVRERPWRVCHFADGPPVTVVLEFQSYAMHIGGHVRLTVIGETAEVLSESVCQTAPNYTLAHVSLDAETDPAHPLLVVESTNAFGEGAADRQYLARIGDRFDRVRCEDDCRRAIPALWGSPGPHQSPAEWEADLASGDRLRILRALTWLVAWHPADETPIVTQTAARDGVNARIAELSRNDDRWIQEAAMLAANAKANK